MTWSNWTQVTGQARAIDDPTGLLNGKAYVHDASNNGPTQGITVTLEEAPIDNSPLSIENMRITEFFVNTVAMGGYTRYRLRFIDSNNYYDFAWNLSNSNLYVYRVKNGTSTLIANSNMGTELRLLDIKNTVVNQVVTSDAQIQIYASLNGTYAQFSVNDTTANGVTGPGKLQTCTTRQSNSLYKRNLLVEEVTL